MSEIRSIAQRFASRVAQVESKFSPLLAPAKSHNHRQIELGLAKADGQVKSLLDRYEMSFVFFQRDADDSSAFLIFHDWAIELRLYCNKDLLFDPKIDQGKRIGLSFLYLKTLLSQLTLFGTLGALDDKIFDNVTSYKNSYVEQKNEALKPLALKLDKFLIDLIRCMCADGLTPVITATSPKRFGIYQKALSRSNLISQVELMEPKM